MLGKLYWFQKYGSLGEGMLKSWWIKNDNVAVKSYMEKTDCLEGDGYSIWKDWLARNGVCSDKFVYTEEHGAGFGATMIWGYLLLKCN